MSKKDIKAIDKTTVHRICSGQVVLSLAIAVKELVENSLDAGATSVEIKLKEYGSDSIEVIDNGQGVRPENFPGLALKHHTSKLRDFSDLVGVETFGFRGEALSSLCALSDLTVVTRHADQNCATTLVFDSNGILTQETSCSRQVGTTVILSRLFHSLPVRQKEFHKNIKREFNKMIQLLYAYCLISTNVKILCTNQTKGSRTTLVSTQGCLTVRENISCVFSSKQLNGLLSVETCLPNEEMLAEMKFKEEDCSIFKLDGFISSCEHGSGRSSTDRQFFYINSRPCEPSKVIKAINETYHHFNPNQYPFVFLNVEIKKDSVDVNVTPDKRQIFMDREKLLVAIIKSSLEKTFEKIPSTFVMNNVSEKKGEKKSEELGLFERWRHKNDLKRNLEDTNPKSPKIPKLQKNLQPSLSSFLTLRSHQEEEKIEEVQEDQILDDKNILTLKNHPEGEKLEDKTFAEEGDIFDEEKSLSFIKFEEIQVPKITENIQQNDEIFEEKSEIIEETEFKPVVFDSYIERGKKCVKMKVDINKIKRQKTISDNILNSVRFRAAIDQNDQAEEELKKEISKEMFEKMEILGQFNLGFIVAKLGPDLFIIDQHASDEKYNFETLQKTTVITNQKLVVPEVLSLTAANESVLMDNLEIFKKNGFEFKIDETAPPTKRVFLTAKPLSKNWLFGKEDIDELIFMLQDSPNTDCRPSRVRAMFASRACRKSVMIGTALNVKEMKKLVVQMGTIEHPWNCPHGRPTMRHLVNLDLLDD